MTAYDFDILYERKNTSSLKYDFAMERKGREDLIPLWIADMDFRLPKEITDDVKARAEHGIFGYTDPDRNYKDALKQWFLKRHGFEIKDEWNTVEPGIVYSISAAIRAYTEKGDAVLVQEPVYYPFMDTIRLNGRRVVNNELVYKNGRYEIDFEDFENLITENEVKMFVLCSPHNPVGRVWSREELIKLADICLKHDVLVFSDEIHSDFVYEGKRHVSYITLGEKYTKKLILGTSPGKTFNIAGLQVANIIIPDREIREAFRRENEAAGYSQGNTLGMCATASCYRKGEIWLEELLKYLEGNLSYVRDFLERELPEVKLVEPEGTYLLWLDFSRVTKDGDDLEKLITDESKLWLDPGKIFGTKSELFQRINIACPRQLLERALGQLRDAIRRREK
ncbi:MAG: pyridoxal phosphate-dependent aminotransferase [Lachnospiraceae bacterium]|nr:pyridoxal phosphate-dependent aminotransferase [Lachnospiraceae bacterium]